MSDNGSGIQYSIDFDENAFGIGEYQNPLFRDGGLDAGFKIIADLARVEEFDVFERRNGSFIPRKGYGWEYSKLDEADLIEETTFGAELTFEAPAGFRKAIDVILNEGVRGDVIDYNSDHDPQIETSAGTLLITEYHERPGLDDTVRAIPVQEGDEYIEAKLVERL